MVEAEIRHKVFFVEELFRDECVEPIAHDATNGVEGLFVHSLVEQGFLQGFRDEVFIIRLGGLVHANVDDFVFLDVVDDKTKTIQ